MGESYRGYLDPTSGRQIVFARPATKPELWLDYLHGARATYRRHGVESALDYDRVRNGLSTALFAVALEPDGKVVGGLRVQGPYARADQATAIGEWAGRAGSDELRRQIADRLSDGAVEIKAVWVDHDVPLHHEITDAIARVIVHSMTLLGVRYAFCTAASHAIPRWESTGAVVSTDVTPVAYPDDRYRTKLLWWDQLCVYDTVDPGQLPALLRESRQLTAVATGTPSAAA